MRVSEEDKDSLRECERWVKALVLLYARYSMFVVYVAVCMNDTVQHCISNWNPTKTWRDRYSTVPGCRILYLWALQFQLALPPPLSNLHSHLTAIHPSPLLTVSTSFSLPPSSSLNYQKSLISRSHARSKVWKSTRAQTGSWWSVVFSHLHTRLFTNFFVTSQSQVSSWLSFLKKTHATFEPTRPIITTTAIKELVSDVNFDCDEDGMVNHFYQSTNENKKTKHSLALFFQLPISQGSLSVDQLLCVCLFDVWTHFPHLDRFLS